MILQDATSTNQIMLSF